ncbi:MAG: RNase adapter RapZ [Pseudomonadota bacterium]
MKKLVIVSGLSGSGKSTALNVLEDADYYCIDNLPLGLLLQFVDQAKLVGPSMSKAAVGIDARNLTTDLSAFAEILSEIKARGVVCEVIYLDADDDILFKRFSESRRKHPLTKGNLSLAEAISSERTLLAPIHEKADLFIDTSRTNVHRLRTIVKERVVGADDGKMSLMFMSFGYKHGVPADVDFVFDVRCLPNPHWEPNLRAQTGKEAGVAEYLATQPMVQEMEQEIVRFLETWIPRFVEENRSYMTVAIGCTGGQHRSVYLVERLREYFASRHEHVMTRHRELP